MRPVIAADEVHLSTRHIAHGDLHLQSRAASERDRGAHGRHLTAGHHPQIDEARTATLDIDERTPGAEPGQKVALRERVGEHDRPRPTDRHLTIRRRSGIVRIAACDCGDP